MSELDFMQFPRLKSTFWAVSLALLVLPLRAEDWKTADGKTYHDVKVLSHNAAYVTILDRDGGARLRLATLSPDLQKRFAYDPAKAAPVIAATQAADQRDQQALAKEKKQLQARSDRQQKADAVALNAALFSPPPDPDFGPPRSAATNSPPGGPDVASDQNAISSEPSTEIDDYDSGDYGDYGYGDDGFGYGGYYGYGGGYGRGYGYRGYHGGWGNHSYGNRRGGGGAYRGVTIEPSVQVNPRH
jgi:hypothetical protein